MRKNIVLIVLGLVGAGVSYFYISESPAYVTYKKFSTAMLRGKREDALKLASGPDVLSGQDEDRTQTIGYMPAEALTSIHYALESESKNADGSVRVQAILTVRFDPPGATSAMGAMTSKFRQ